MEKLDQKLNNLSRVEIPGDIHLSVMKKINYLKIIPVLIFIFSLLTINFIFTSWHINTSLVNAEFVDMLQDFLQVFSFNFSFINTAVGSFFEIVSPVLFLSGLISFVGALYVAKKINTYRRYLKYK